MDIDLIKQCLLTARNEEIRNKPRGERDEQYGWTPLHAAVALGVDAAAASGNLDEVERLLGEDNILVNVSSRDGWTPLHVAVGLSGENRDKVDKILEILLGAGADRNARNKDGWTPMHVAAALHHKHTACVVKKLAECLGQERTSGGKCVDCFPDARDGKGRTALHIAAAKNKCLKVVSILCERGYDLNAQDGAGNTPLHKAAAKENLQIVRLLLARGANPWLRNGKGQLPRDLAEQNKKLRNILAAP